MMMVAMAVMMTTMMMTEAVAVISSSTYWNAREVRILGSVPRCGSSSGSSSFVSTTTKVWQ
jgi:hypothetical protein